MKNRSINVPGLLLVLAGIVAAGYLFKMHLCGGSAFGPEPVAAAGEPAKGGELSTFVYGGLHKKG